MFFAVIRYPADVKAFTHSGMKGVWDRERAGQRMKLKEPQTWERLLSMEGNKAATWEKLIGLKNKKLRLSIELNNVHGLVDHSSATTESLYQAHDDRKKKCIIFPSVCSVCFRGSFLQVKSPQSLFTTHQ